MALSTFSSLKILKPIRKKPISISSGHLLFCKSPELKTYAFWLCFVVFYFSLSCLLLGYETEICYFENPNLYPIGHHHHLTAFQSEIPTYVPSQMLLSLMDKVTLITITKLLITSLYTRNSNFFNFTF